MRVGKACFIVNTILVASLIGYFWLAFLPRFEGHAVYASMSNFITLITACFIGAYVASSLVMLDKV